MTHLARIYQNICLIFNGYFLKRYEIRIDSIVWVTEIDKVLFIQPTTPFAKDELI